MSFAIGMAKINVDIISARNKIMELQREVSADSYLNVIPSIRKRMEKGGFFFHATDDPPEVRQVFYKFLRDLDCSIEVVVARKKAEIYGSRHNIGLV